MKCFAQILIVQQMSIHEVKIAFEMKNKLINSSTQYIHS
jgi:hypothetical protein